MIKMVVCDMDGTLLNSDLKISDENLQAIKELRAKGIRFCVATGRPEQLIKEYIKPLNMKDPIIMYNGSVIGHPHSLENLYELKLKDEDIKEIISYCEDNDIICMPYAKNRIISKPNYRVSFFEERNKNLPEEERCIFEDISDIDKIVDENNINKILLIEKDNDKNKAIKEKLHLNNRFEIVSSQKGFIDINPLGASKGNALKVLADHFGYQMDEIVAFGDQDNDESMLNAAGIGVAMGNASLKARSAANDLTDTNDNDGVSKWIRKHLL